MNGKENIALHPEKVSMEACSWIAKLDRGELTNTEARAFRDWLAENKENRLALTNQLAEWSEMDVLSELARLDLNYDRPGSQIKPHRFWEVARSSRSWGGVLSFGVLLLATLLILDQRNAFNPFEESDDAIQIGLNTSVGEQKTEALPDGSVVHINTKSKADISYTKDERSVVLHSGEAFFDVAPEKERPFVVYVDDTAVKAVGTAFAVHKEKGTISVSVTEGIVEFISGGVTTTVAANRALSANDASPHGNVAVYANQQTSINNQPAEALARRLDWQDGMLEFRGESLGQVVQELSRYTDAQIVIVDEDIKGVRLGGYFKVGDIEGFASTLALGFNIHVDVVSNELIQLSRYKGNSEIE